jgi:hypothetical protein
MWLYILLAVFLLLAFGGGTWGRSRYGYWGWSPATIILLVALVLFLTGHISFHG